MKYENETFDVVLDKGLLNTVLVIYLYSVKIILFLILVKC
jgi:hypothetical protein